MASWNGSWSGAWAGGWDGRERAGGGPFYVDAGFMVLVKAESEIGAATAVRAGIAASAIATALIGSQVSGGQQPQPGFSGGGGAPFIQRRRLRLPILPPKQLPHPERERVYIEAGMSASVAGAAAFGADVRLTFRRAWAEEEDLLLLLIAA
jgi:hypothetical protein